MTEAQKKVVNLALSQVGTREGNNNWNKYADDPLVSRLYGWAPQNQPWCATFANWVYLNAFNYDIGCKLTYGGSAACSNAAQNYKNNGAFYKSPQIGDQSFYYSGGGINHTGIVVAIDDNYYTAIEGNYSDQVSSVRHRLNGSDTAGFGRPNWSLVTGSNQATEPVTPVAEDHELTLPLIQYGSKGDAVSVAQGLLNLRKFDCGTADGEFGPKTLAAVNRCQEFFKLKVDGKIGKDTWGVLK